MEIHLKIIEGPAKQKTFTLDKSEIVIGRSRQSTLTIPAKGISKRHCRLWEEDDRLFIEDLGSTNGTEVNGIRLERKMSLRSGDRIRISVFEIEVHYGDIGETEAALDEMELELEDRGRDDALEPLSDIPDDDDYDDDMALIDEIDDDDILELDDEEDDLLSELEDEKDEK